jgi:PilZ domain
MLQERRRAPRTRVRKAAQLAFNHPCSVIACTVHDVSISGACLQVPCSIELPDAFELSFDSFRSARGCQVVWRAENRLGVSFGQAFGKWNRPETPSLLERSIEETRPRSVPMSKM